MRWRQQKMPLREPDREQSVWSSCLHLNS
jgi:hypothetical protein